MHKNWEFLNIYELGTHLQIILLWLVRPGKEADIILLILQEPHKQKDI